MELFQLFIGQKPGIHEKTDKLPSKIRKDCAEHSLFCINECLFDENKTGAILLILSQSQPRFSPKHKQRLFVQAKPGGESAQVSAAPRNDMFFGNQTFDPIRRGAAFAAPRQSVKKAANRQNPDFENWNDAGLTVTETKGDTTAK